MPNGRDNRGVSSYLHAAAEGAMESLEPRQMLSGEQLPVGAVWLPWGEGQVAAMRGSYLMQFDDMHSTEQAELMAREVATRLGVRVSSVDSIARGRYATIQTTDQIRVDTVNRLVGELPWLKSFEPDQIRQIARTPNDPQYGDQYALDNTGQFIQGSGFGTSGADSSVAEAWDITIGTRDNVIAVIDSGIDVTHPDLALNIWRNPGEISGNGIDDDGNGFVDDINGWDFGTNDNNPNDDIVGHGTEVAGVIGAVGNNNVGMAGVNWNVALMALKIADQFGAYRVAAIVAAHDYATMMITRGLNVIASVNSYGGFAPEFYRDAPEGFDAERDAIQRFVEVGATFVTSAGNNGFDNDNPDFTFFPSSYNIPGVISVAATDNNDQLAGFSNYGAETVELGAAGVAVLTTTAGGGYAFVNGTSFSGPMVAGAVGLLKAVKPNASAIEIREALFNSVDHLPSLQGRVRSGGRLNVARAIQVIQIDGPVVRVIDPGPIATQVIPGTSTPRNTITIDFSKDIDEAFLSAAAVSLVGAGVDDNIGTGDDVNVPITSVVRSATEPRHVTITLNLTGFAQQRLPVDPYRLTLQPSGFRDTTGNFLNGNDAAGTPHVYDFRIVAVTGDNEPNDATGEATALSFDSTGAANVSGVTLGNGVFGPLDVDVYRINMSRGGQITAEITAQRLASGSTLDSYLRLFNANGVELAANDQFFGQDSYLDFFVQTGGTYYLGVSGFGNDRYNPAVAGSGNSQSTGVYNLRVATRLASDDIVTHTFFTPTPAPPAGTDVFLNYNAPAGPTTSIPPNAPSQTQGTTTAFIDIADSRQILDVNLRLRLTHTYVSDLVISLISPQGTERVLYNGADASQQGNSGDNFTNTLFDDEASASVQNGLAPFTGAFRPFESLGLFDGQSAVGRWTLRINDRTPLNTGQLENWALDITFLNNIFGPFESNDTIVTAKTLGITGGNGSNSVTAFVGDGGFGVFDRDIFFFDAVIGSSLTAVATPSGVLNSALRLFDSLGTQILLANPPGNSSRIDSYVFASGGRYYIAVSESSNVVYNPNAVGDGTSNPSQTTGEYTLDVSLAPGVSDPGQIIRGSVVSMGVNTNGFFGAFDTAGAYSGLNFNGIEFLPINTFSQPVGTALTAQSFFGAVASGNDFANGSPARPNAVPFALTNEGDSFNNRVTSKGDYRGLTMERSFSFAQSDGFIAIDVFLTNTTIASLTGVAWMEGFNPNPGFYLGENNRNTLNDIDATGKMASARYVNNQFGQGLTIALAAPSGDSRARAMVLGGGQDPRDPTVLLNTPVVDPDGASGDSQLAMVFDVGTLASGATASFRYFVFMGTTPTAVDAMYAQVNNGTGLGHLAATPSTPATETLSDGTVVPQLPYRVYYPEGNANNGTYEFLPLSNPNDQSTRVIVIARYEWGARDQVLADMVVRGNARSGLTLTTPALVAAGNQLIDHPEIPYAIEVRADKPFAATSSHYDLNLLPRPSGVGESFTSRTDSTWTFGEVVKAPSLNDFIVWYNASSANGKVTATYYRADGTAAYVRSIDTSAFRRSGIDVGGPSNLVKTLGGSANETPFVLPAGTYGVVLTSDVPIVAALSHYDRTATVAEGSMGNSGAAATAGVMPEGQFGLNGTQEIISALNTTGVQASVLITFLYDNGSSYRATLTVNARSESSLDVSTLPGFIMGRPYAILYNSNTPVTVLVRSNAFGQQLASAAATTAYTLWSFGEGFRPGDNNNHPGVVEHLRLFNPNSTETTIEITVAYDGLPGSETFRRTIPARAVVELDMDQFITGIRRLSNNWYATSIKAPQPIVAYMTHYDRAFPGGFGTIGTPLGRSQPIT
ncbi:Thermophilic serine proteinase [Phycisphaerales bacterium]|nr:Thermophilic serine proteinase [Phycisphaerales bacterium]